MLELKEITYKLPDGRILLDKINLRVAEGETVVLTGPNGGGKTTLAKVIAGVAKFDEGQIFLDDKDISKYNITERAEAGIAYAFQQPVRFRGLSTKKMLSLASKRDLNDEEMREVLKNVGLCPDGYIDRDVDSSLSGGEIKRIEIASVLLRNAKVYVFDEPEAGIDLWSFTNLIRVFQGLKYEQNKSIVIISHQERILEIADKIAVVADGKISAYGNREKILPSLYCKSDICPFVSK